MQIVDKLIESTRTLVAALAHKAAADRHGTPEQSTDCQAIVDSAISGAWLALAELDANAAPNATPMPNISAWRVK